MNDDIDIERALKEYSSDPSARVKRTVISRFKDVVGGRAGTNLVQGSKTGFWRKPIPLFVVTATLVLAAGLSFFAGRKTSAPQPQIKSLPESAQESTKPAAPELTWEVAPNDVI